MVQLTLNPSTDKVVAVYPRVSSEDQQERETIETQIEFASKYCDLHQLNIYDWYKDDGVSGMIPFEERPEGKRLLEDAKAGKFKVLLIYNLKRLGRTARIIINAVYELEQYGVQIRSMTEPFDTGDPNGRFLMTVLAGVAELDRENLLETMWHGANRAARKGKWLGGIVPYGYRKNEEGFLEICEDPLPGKEDMSEAGVVRLIFHLTAIQRFTTIQISDYLNALKIPPSYAKDGRKMKKGKRKMNTAGIWRPGRIRNMITNTTYKGIHEYGKRSDKDREIITREVPAIVSDEIWDKAQEVLHNNRIESFKNAKRSYLLRGLIKCGTCGLTYHGTAYGQSKNKMKGYYVCGGKTAYRGPLEGKCKSKNIPQTWIEEIVWNDCVEFINNPGKAIQELADSMEERKSQKGAYEKEKQMLLKAASEKENDKQAILELYRKKIINATDVEQQLQEITKEKSALEDRAKELDKQIETEDSMINDYDNAEILLAELKEKLKHEIPFEIKREIVLSLVKEIVVETIQEAGGSRPKANVSIRYSFSKAVPHTVKDSSPPPT